MRIEFLLYLRVVFAIFTSSKYFFKSEDSLQVLLWLQLAIKISCGLLTFVAVDVQNSVALADEWQQIKMLFAVPMVWREQTNHAIDCYFCLTTNKEKPTFLRKNKYKIVYPNYTSALKPVFHRINLPVSLHSLPEESSAKHEATGSTTERVKIHGGAQH